MLVALISGCANNHSGLDRPDDSDQIQINVDPEVDTVKSIGDITITVPAGTFPTSTSIFVSRRVANDSPDFDGFEPVGRLSEITITVPTEDLGADIIIDLPAEASLLSGRSSAVTTIYGLFAKLADGKWAMISKLPQTSAEYMTWGAKIVVDRVVFSSLGKKVTAVIGKFGWVKPEMKQELVLVYSNSNMTNGNDLILAHGWNATRHAFDLLIQAVIATGRYSNIYALEYNWCDYIEKSGSFLALQIKVLASRGRYMDVWAHSMGALVSRYAFENSKATKNVRTFVSICGANEGSILGKVENIMSYIRTDFLNKPESARAGLYFPAFDTYSTAQLVPSSSLLNSLNTPTSGVQLGNINYTLIAGRSWTDLVVGQDSALASNTDLRSMTLGTIIKISTIHDHDGLIDTEGGVAELLGYANPSANDQLVLTFRPSAMVEAAPTDTAWYWRVNLYNRGGSGIVVRRITFDEYNGLGDWLCVSWYNPSTTEGTFPITPVEFNLEIASGDTKEIGVRLWACSDKNRMISDLDLKYQSRSFVVSACFEDSTGHVFKTDKILVLTIPGVTPSAPKTRSRSVSPAVSLLGPSRR